MERKIGEEFESRILNTTLYTKKQPQPTIGCNGCVFLRICENDTLRSLARNLELGECSGSFRKDKEFIIFKISISGDDLYDSGIYDVKALLGCVQSLWDTSDWRSIISKLEERIFWCWYESFSRREITWKIDGLLRMIFELKDESLSRALIIGWLEEKEEEQKLKGEL